MRAAHQTAFIVVLFLTALAYSASAQAPAEVRLELEQINRRIEHNYVTENSDSLSSWYTERLTFFPEYKPAIFNSKNLKKFYKDWFKAVEVKTYQKKIVTVELLGDYLLEIGTFSSNYLSARQTPLEYNGKYLIMWQKDPNRKWRIMSEAFGANTYLDAVAVPYATVQVSESTISAKNEVSPALLAEVEEFNAAVIKAVTDGDGEARANGFTPDGIYLPHFETILSGKDVIRPYMLKTYRPGALIKVAHSYNRIYDLGNYVFVNGHFKGSWGNAANGGKLEGNMSNLMKRTENGKLLMHRQIGNNDRQ